MGYSLNLEKSSTICREYHTFICSIHLMVFLCYYLTLGPLPVLGEPFSTSRVDAGVHRARPNVYFVDWLRK